MFVGGPTAMFLPSGVKLGFDVLIWFSGFVVFDVNLVCEELGFIDFL